MSAKPSKWSQLDQDQKDYINEMRRKRRLIKFRNCYCHKQATRVIAGTFVCDEHYAMERERMFQDKRDTERNIKECNARCERERYAKLKAAGLCVTCGKRKSYEGCLRCPECQEKRRALNAKYRGKSDTPIHPWRAYFGR